ncbi:glycosyltransferase [Salinispora oceanensis]|uniref:glycosyltransferase n=1 Tax=Salinispora oceanensis TaxID=1050199 RepID=UPI000376F449|nr:glycosyltransferase [Salinispora oceanensis]
MPSVERRLTVLDGSGVGPGGITRVLNELVRHWPSGHDLRLVGAPPGFHGPAEIVVSHQSGGRARTIAAATSALRRERHGQILSLSPSLALAGARLPVTTIVHDLAFRLWPRGLSRSVREYRRVSYATAIRRSTKLLCVSARTRHDLLGLYNVDDGRAAVWHPGSDLPSPGVPPVLPAEYVVVAGHAPHKGVELAIEALRAYPRYTLVVFTGGTRHFSDVSGRTVFLGRLDDGAYAATVAGAAAFLMPSHFEGFGLPAAEALALGTPTIVSPDPALHEATGGAAIRMRSWTAEALVEALHKLEKPDPAAVRTWREATAELVGGLWP